jgi:type I restriction-modification system DNA methylase subunit
MEAMLPFFLSQFGPEQREAMAHGFGEILRHKSIESIGVFEGHRDEGTFYTPKEFIEFLLEIIAEEIAGELPEPGALYE